MCILEMQSKVFTKQQDCEFEGNMFVESFCLIQANDQCPLAFRSTVLPGGSIGCCSGLGGNPYHVFHHPHRCMEEGKMDDLNFRFPLQKSYLN